MADLPIPQQPNRNPLSVMGAGAEFLNPFTKAESDLLAARRKALEEHYRQMFGQPIPEGTTGGAFMKDLQGIAGSLAMFPYGAAAINLDLQKGIVDGGRSIADYFTGTGYVDPRLGKPELQPLQELPGVRTFGESATGPGGVAMPSLDGTTIVPGSGGSVPGLPKFNLDFKPADYTQANQRLEAARLRPQRPQGTSLGSYLEGAALSAGQVDPTTPWPTALGQILSGAVAGNRDWRHKQEEAELRNEALERQYQLMRAGVDEQRATAEAQQAYNRTKMEMDVLQQNFENSWKIAQDMQPRAQINGDGAVVITSKKPDGSLSIQRIGFDDALKANMALANARNMGGKSGEIGFLNQLIQGGNVDLAASAMLVKVIGNNMDAAILPQGSTAQQKYQKDTTDYDTNLANQGVSKDIFLAMSTQNKLNNLMAIMKSNPELERYILQSLGLMRFEAQPTVPAPSTDRPASQTDFQQFSPFIGP